MQHFACMAAIRKKHYSLENPLVILLNKQVVGIMQCTKTPFNNPSNIKLSKPSYVTL